MEPIIPPRGVVWLALRRKRSLLGGGGPRIQSGFPIRLVGRPTAVPRPSTRPSDGRLHGRLYRRLTAVYTDPGTHLDPCSRPSDARLHGRLHGRLTPVYTAVYMAVSRPSDGCLYGRLTAVYTDPDGACSVWSAVLWPSTRPSAWPFYGRLHGRLHRRLPLHTSNV